MRPADRGVSAVLGVVLLLAIVLTGMAVTVAIGATALDQTKDQLGVDRAEKTLTQLDSKSAVVALGSSNHQSVSLAQEGGSDYTVERERGWMNVSIENTTSGTVMPVVNTSLGAVVYENGQVELAYQGGGVWKNTEGGTTMISPPEFHFRNATLTLPIIAVDGEQGVGGTAEISRNGTTVQKFANESHNANFTNPLENGKVNVTVHSEYYEAWGRYFEQRTQGEVEYDHDDNTVTITLVVPVGNRKVTSAVAATSGSGRLKLTGSGGDPARSDSYTSDDGNGYSGDNHANGNITTAGEIEVGGNACVNGSIMAGSVTVSNNNCAGDKVTGDIFWVTSKSIHSSVTADTQQFDGTEPIAPITGVVDDKVDTFEDDPDSSTAISASDELQFSSDTATIDAGQYYLDKLVVEDGETLTLDTNGGDVRIGVEKYIKLTGDATIEVVGPGQAKVYVKGEATTNGHHVHLKKSSSDVPQVTIADDNATKFWLLGKPDLQTYMRGKGSDRITFIGVVYAPGGGTGTGHAYIEKAKVFGGLVSSTVEVNQGGEFHYDRALRQRRAVPKDHSVVSITYLHVSVTRVNVTG